MFFFSNNKIRKLIFILSFFIFAFSYIGYVYSSPVLVARALLPRLFGNVVAKRAASTEVATLTATSVNRMTLPALTASSPLIRTGNALNWIGLGYGLNALQNDLFSGNDKVYSIDYDNQKFLGSSPESLLTQLFEYDVQHNKITCIGEAPCQFSSLRDIRLRTDLGDTVYFTGTYDLTNASGSFIPNRSYTQYFFHGKKQVIFHDGIPYPADNIDLDDLLKSLYYTEVSLDEIANLLNAILMNASLQPDYKGIPFNSSNAITKDEIKNLLKENNESQTVYFHDLFESVKTGSNNNLIIINNTTETKPTTPTDKDDDFDENDIKYPDLDMPTAEQILQPYKSFFPYLQDFDLPSRNAQCPVWNIPFLNENYKVDSHCPLIEQNRSIIESIFSLVWAFIALRKLLSA
ncbi:hypothetical protein MC862_001632 [Proteus mirabilis]|nr:hypothetical protein [Proteus mirabilis]